MLAAPIEFARSVRPRAISHVLMDWDGTTSLSRAGWADIMAGLYSEHLPGIPGESDVQRRAFARAELMSLNGKPSIHQMSHLAELVRQRGGRPLSAEDYHDEFQDRLRKAVQTRLDEVRERKCAAESLLMRGVREFLERLVERSITITLATGSLLDEVRLEMELLDVARYFERIHGPQTLDDTTFSKRAVINAIVNDDGVAGAALLAFGDGPVEIAETRAVGGVAVGVASDEDQPGSGRVDPAKRGTLLDAGADAIIADFHGAPEILDAFILA